MIPFILSVENSQINRNMTIEVDDNGDLGLRETAGELSAENRVAVNEDGVLGK